MDPISTFALLAAAAFGAGVLNAIAGGGTFLTFPALVWTGVPPIAANATSALAVCPGYLGSALGFRQELAALPRALLIREVVLSALGGVAGALLLLVTPAEIEASRPRHRSPLVWRCVQDHLRGQRFDLAAVVTDASAQHRIA